MSKRRQSISQLLGSTYGGQWKYSATLAEWKCDDGLRSVRRCCSIDLSEETRTEYWLYGDITPKILPLTIYRKNASLFP